MDRRLAFAAALLALTNCGAAEPATDMGLSTGSTGGLTTGATGASEPGSSAAATTIPSSGVTGGATTGTGPSSSTAGNATGETGLTETSGTASGAEPFEVLEEWTVNAPGHDQPFDGLYSTPIGWGYHAPNLVLVDGVAYATVFYPCDPSDRQGYCFGVFADGAQVGGAVDMRADFAPLGFTPTQAYQPPSLFHEGGELFAAYVVGGFVGGQVAAAVQLVRLSISSPSWELAATHLMPANQTLGYLGGAMGPGGSIVVGGWALLQADASPASLPHALEFLRIAPPYTNWSPPFDLLMFNGPAFQPLYPHVVVHGDTDFSAMTVLANGQSCEGIGGVPTNYKNVASYRATFGVGSTPVWSDAAGDAVQSPATNGSPCLWNNQRFGLDFLLDDASTAWSIQRAQDLTAIMPPPNEHLSNGRFELRFELRQGGSLVNAALGDAFAPVLVPESIDAISFTRLADGRWALVANERGNAIDGGSEDIAIVSTTDFVEFSEAFALPTEFGAGHSVGLVKPDKNGSDAPADLHLWHSGNLDHPSAENTFLRYRYARIRVGR